MQFRKLGKLDWTPSALGFGCMRLPTPDGIALNPNILQDETDEMVRFAIENGVNYFDTAYLYHSGKSEIAIGKALKGGLRDKVKLATKAPMMVIKSREDYDRILDDQLNKLGVEMIDFYLFHSLSKKHWSIVKDEDLIERAEAAQKAGKIGHIAFSFHDDYELFEEIVNSYDKWLFCQLQYNFVDVNFQAGMKGLKLAASKGLGVVAMEPLKGGKLGQPIPEAAEILRENGVEKPLAELALNWIWDQPEVSTVLSGMSNMEQLSLNIKNAEGPYTLAENELKALEEIRELYDGRKTIPCSGCSYCMPCPNGLNIPVLLSQYNDALSYGYDVESKRLYNLFGKQGRLCTNCGECSEKCPQAIPIGEWMPKIDEMLSF